MLNDGDDGVLPVRLGTVVTQMVLIDSQERKNSHVRISSNNPRRRQRHKNAQQIPQGTAQGRRQAHAAARN